MSKALPTKAYFFNFAIRVTQSSPKGFLAFHFDITKKARKQMCQDFWCADRSPKAASGMTRNPGEKLKTSHEMKLHSRSDTINGGTVNSATLNMSMLHFQIFRVSFLYEHKHMERWSIDSGTLK